VSEFSIIIPAHDESAVIARCLRGITDSLAPGEAEIIVVCNGCTDTTADIARTFGSLVRVVETPIRSKANALNIGDSSATVFPRIYLDADIEVESKVLRDLARLLVDTPGLLAASPRGVVTLEGRGRLVRSFYKVWTSLPYFREGPFGVGLYAFSRAGRERFDEFPDVISDDGFARLCVSPSERGVSGSGTFRIIPPRTVVGIIRINIRARAGMYQLRTRFPNLYCNETTSVIRSIRELVCQRELWCHAPIYFWVMLIASLGGRMKLWMGQEHAWERDQTSRDD
jgi:glycosyltransferase involved in cell wall biosynthesis